MNSDRELFNKALEALNLINHLGNTDDELLQVGQAVTLIRERLAEDDADPVAWVAFTKDTNAPRDVVSIGSKPPPIWPEAIPLYTRPASVRKTLSDEEILKVATKSPPFIPWLLREDVTLGDVRKMAVDFARAIEKAHDII